MLETEQQNNRKKECNLSVHVDDHLTSKERDQLNQLLSSESNSISNCVNVDLDNLVQRDYSEANRQLLGGFEGVIALQKKLGATEIDGDFGMETFQLLIKYQREHGLRVDGLAGPITQSSIGIATYDTTVAKTQDSTKKRISPTHKPPSGTRENKGELAPQVIHYDIVLQKYDRITQSLQEQITILNKQRQDNTGVVGGIGDIIGSKTGMWTTGKEVYESSMGAIRRQAQAQYDRFLNELKDKPIPTDPQEQSRIKTIQQSFSTLIGAQLKDVSWGTAVLNATLGESKGQAGPIGDAIEYSVRGMVGIAEGSADMMVGAVEMTGKMIGILMAAGINSDARDQFVRDCASILSKITLENAQKLLSYVSQHIQDIGKLPSDEQADAIGKLTGNILAMFGTLGAVRVARAGKSIAGSGKVLAQSGVQSIQQPGARILGATQIVSGSTGVVAGKTAQVAAISVGTLGLHPSGNVTLQGGKQATKIVTQPHPNTATLQNTVPSAVSKTPSGHHILQNTNNVTPTRSPNTNSQPQKTHTSDTIHQNPSQDLHNQGLPVVPNKPQTPHLVDPSLSVHQEYLNKIDTKTQVRLQEMYASALQQNKGKLITNDTIVGVPMYAGEKNFHFIDALLAQKGAAFKTVIFVNAPKTGTSAISAKEFQQKIVNLNTYIKSHAGNKSDQFIILTQHYETRVGMGTIRGDMVDSIALSLDPKVKKPVFVGIDADTWKLSDNYVASNRDKFNTTDVSYTTGSLRWTDPEKHNYTWLSEMLFQSTYRPFFVKNGKFPHAAGGSTSFRIDRYMEVGGYDRSILAGQAGEDARLGVSFAKNNMQGTPIGTKVYVDPRRGEQALQQGKKFGNQWHDIFNPVDSNSLNNQIYTESDRIVSLLRTGKTLKEDELDAIVSKINDHLDDGYFNDPSRMYNPDVVRKRFIRFWNMNVTDSLYQAGQKDGKFIFIKKSS